MNEAEILARLEALEAAVRQLQAFATETEGPAPPTLEAQHAGFVARLRDEA